MLLPKDLDNIALFGSYQYLRLKIDTHNQP